MFIRLVTGAWQIDELSEWLASPARIFSFQLPGSVCCVTRTGIRIVDSLEVSRERKSLFSEVTQQTDSRTNRKSACKRQDFPVQTPAWEYKARVPDLKKLLFQERHRLIMVLKITFAQMELAYTVILKSENGLLWVSTLGANEVLSTKVGAMFDVPGTAQASSAFH